MSAVKHDEIRQAVREQYGKVAQNRDHLGGGCCGGPVDSNAISQNLGYSAEQVGIVPEGANMGLGCGNPQAIAAIKQNETVLDLGSGGGFDCFLASQQVGSGGKVIGVDMTPDMVSKARTNADKGQYANVEFRLGEIESLPVADNSINVIISNCVINLSPDKARVFAEAFRVLQPGGRLAISDVVASIDLPKDMADDMALYTGCMAGASTVAELETMLANSGFVDIQIKPKDDSRSFIRDWVPGSDISEYVLSASIEAVKPA